MPGTVIPPLTLGSLIKVTYRTHVLAQVGEVTSGLVVSALTGAVPSLQSLADYLQSQFEAAAPPLFANTVVLRSCRLDLQSAVTGFVLVSAEGTSNNLNGTGGATLAPTQVAPVVAKITGLAGPSHRGRIYSPFMPLAGLAASGELLVGFRNALTSIWSSVLGPQTLAAGPNSITVSPVLFHKGGPFVTYDDILDIRATGMLGTQKRRGDYGRANP